MSSYIETDHFKCYNPATMKSLGNVYFTSLKDIESILESAKESAGVYNHTSLTERKKLVRSYRKAIINKTDQFVDLIQSETGKSYQDAVMEFFVGVDLVTILLGYSKKALSPNKRSIGYYLHKKGWVEYHPHGVAGIISPWNYPFILALSPVIEALLAGNTVLLKPSEHTPLIGNLLKDTFNEISDDKRIFQTIIGTADTGKILVESSKTDIICFTGSTAVGKVIAASCGEQLKPCILELGGKDAMIVLDDANLERASNACIWGGFSNAGQTCISVERVYVFDSVFDQFSELIKKKIALVSCGTTPNDQIGAMTMAAGRDKVKQQIAEIKSSCKEIYSSDKFPKNGGQFFPPTIVFEPDENGEVCREESFGPVITVSRVDSDKEAVEKANDNRYGLAASVFTSNKKRGRRIAGLLQAGQVTINDIQTGYGIGSLPFGGVKESGMGRVHGVEGLRSFSRITSVVETRFAFRSEPWWYSGIKSLPKWISRFIKIRYR